MRKTDFNENWQYRRLDGKTYSPVMLPHDAMISEERTPQSAGGVNTGWFTGGDYEYVKRFFLSDADLSKTLFLEFEGVYRNAEVYINGSEAARHAYGYTGFFVSLNAFAHAGENAITVIARNADQPNSRWYSGAGIYRPVWLWTGEEKYVLPEGVKVRPLSVSPAAAEITVCTSDAGMVCVQILDGENVLFEKEVQSTGKVTLRAEVPEGLPWSPGSPKLYTCRAAFGGDALSVLFGFRTVTCNSKEGFCINGKRVILRGACIHHDNGILGARCFPEAEERKIRLLLENGYNAVRSAHNPCSKAMLAACDRLGMLVMDEYCDMWYIHKTRFDYASQLPENYERDIADMISKDFNHPSVVLYSLGNEVAETSEEKGVRFFAKMKAVCKALDPDRPVTAGVNIFFNYLYSLGFGVYSDKKAEQAPGKKVGSEFFNALAGRFGAGFMKRMATLPGCDKKTRSAFAAMDVAGYNYGILRYAGDVKKYPDRVILGSETFCADADAFFALAQRHPAVIGDFVWAGMDYLGEVGVGAWEYREYAPDFGHGVGWITAGSGRLNLIGTPLGEALYTKTAFGLTDAPQIAVRPVSHTGERHSPSAWKFSDALPSWSWNGLDGKRAVVEVYSRAPRVELYLNGKRIGKKKRGKNSRFVFRTRYAGGTLTAVASDEKGAEISRHSLTTAGEKTVLSVLPEKSAVACGEVCFVRLRYTDECGTLKPLERGMVSVNVENGALLALGCAAPYNPVGYNASATDTYYGEALAVVRAGKSGSVRITASDGRLTGTAQIAVRDDDRAKV